MQPFESLRSLPVGQNFVLDVVLPSIYFPTDYSFNQSMDIPWTLHFFLILSIREGLLQLSATAFNFVGPRIDSAIRSHLSRKHRPDFSTRLYRYVRVNVSLGTPLWSRFALRVPFVTVGCCRKVFFSLA